MGTWGSSEFSSDSPALWASCKLGTGPPCVGVNVCQPDKDYDSLYLLLPSLPGDAWEARNSPLSWSAEEPAAPLPGKPQLTLCGRDSVPAASSSLLRNTAYPGWGRLSGAGALKPSDVTDVKRTNQGDAGTESTGHVWRRQSKLMLPHLRQRPGDPRLHLCLAEVVSVNVVTRIQAEEGWPWRGLSQAFPVDLHMRRLPSLVLCFRFHLWETCGKKEVSTDPDSSGLLFILIR